MSRMVHVATEGVRIPVARTRVASLAEGDEAAAWGAAKATFDRFNEADLYLFTVPMWNAGPPYILKQFIDVISQPGMAFGFDPVGRSDEIVGDVYIAPGVARRNARAHGRRVREELLRLVVHGVLHVVGHDHPEDDSRYHSRMWKRQEELLRALGAA